MAILKERERERERMRVLIICICLSVPTNNKTVNLILIQKHVVDEKYNVAIQYGNYFITIKVAGSVDKFMCASNVRARVN